VQQHEKMIEIMKSLSLEEFNLAIKSFVPILIEFWSSSCLVCEVAERYLEKLGQAYQNKIVLARINIDCLLQIIELYSISKLPTFILFKNSIELMRVTGFKNEFELEKAIRKYIK
jgi:thioredoxin 1